MEPVSPSACEVISNDDLLIQILLLLPATSLFLFKFVSKRWLSLITDVSFTRRRSQFPHLDPPSGFFIARPESKSKRELQYEYDLLPLDIRIPKGWPSGKRVCDYHYKRGEVSSSIPARCKQLCSGHANLLKREGLTWFEYVWRWVQTLWISRPMCRKSRLPNFFFGSEASSNVEILQSCNGLLLCRGGSEPFREYYVFNPTINVFRMLPQCENVNSDLDFWYPMRIAFDPTKSPHYKVICVLSTEDDAGLYCQIQTYSSQTCNWTVCGERFCFSLHVGFGSGIYWNEAIHWLLIENGRPVHFKLDMAEHPKRIKIQNPGIMIDERGVDRKLLESGGSLLLFLRNNTQPQLSYVCDMRNEYSGWSVKYIVNLNDIMNPFSETWKAISSVWGIVLGAKEEDSFMVMEVFGKVVEYKFVSKTVRTLGDIGSVRPSHDSVHQFIASFSSV